MPQSDQLSRACRELSANRAVVVPNPAPLAYGVVAASARAVNELKHRPADRNVAVSLHDREQWRQVTPGVDLSPPALDAVRALLSMRLSVLLPLRPQVPLPDWITPAVRDGSVAVFDGFWTGTAPVWREFPRLYGSSANTTGRPPAADAAQAVAMFGDACVVVDVGGSDEPAGTRPASTRSASTMVRIDRRERLELHRSGAQDLASGLAPPDYLSALAEAVGLTTHRPS